MVAAPGNTKAGKPSKAAQRAGADPRAAALFGITPGANLPPAGEAGGASEEARRKFLRIDSFEGTFGFLALDAEFSAAWDGQLYPTARHALLAAQFPAVTEAILKSSSVAEALKAVEGEHESENWQKRRLQVMEKVLRDKFRRSADLRKQLQDTGDRDLAWDNDEDGFWGTVKGRGQNQLGRLLMEIRTSIQEDTEFESWLFICCELEDQEVKRPPIELIEQKNSEDGVEQKKVHRLSGKGFFKFGKFPANAVVALHPSISREHALLLHTKSDVGKRSQGIVLVDMGSKAGTAIGSRKLPHSWVMEPLRNGDIVHLGASTRTLEVRVNLSSQIALLEQQERELRREVNAIDADAANPIEAAKRAAKEEATVFVGNLEYETEKADLIGLFQDCGHIEDVRFPGPQGTTKAVKGICFVTFESGMAARRACGLNFELFKGRKVKVAPASENRREEGEKGKGKSKGDGDRGKGGKGKDGDGDRGKTGKGGAKGEDSRSLVQQGSLLRRLSRSRSGSRRRTSPPAQRSGGGRARRSRSRSKSPTARPSGRDRGRSREQEERSKRRRGAADGSEDSAPATRGRGAARSRSRGQKKKAHTRAPASPSSSSEAAKRSKRRK